MGKKRNLREAAKKINSDSPEARDEGPRLIPLDTTGDRDEEKMKEYHLRLAEIALHGTETPSSDESDD